MIDIDIVRFKKDPDKYIQQILLDGEMFAVQTERGKVVMMEEAEYNVMRQALVALISSDGIVLRDKETPPE